MNLYSNTIQVISTVYKEVYGYKPKSIRDEKGRPPEEANSYLFNLALNQFEGILTGKYFIDYRFRISYDSSKKNWTYDFEAM